jgi:HTH-type transcriptional regulator / antitoxin HipB
MIQNEHQYKVTQNQLKNLGQALIELLKIKNDLRLRQFSARQKGLEMSIATLRQEIEEYDSLKQQKTAIKIAELQELPLALIKARIALGMTQKELAEKMGVKEQQVQRDEADRYSSAGFQRIVEIAKVLGIKIQETEVLLKS